MNCKEFESIVVDLARREVSDSALGTRCWAHAANCSPCAERLFEQEKLTAGFEALNIRTEQIVPPERIEAVLRKEFRKQMAGAQRQSVKSPLPLNVPERGRTIRSRLAWAIAAAVFLAPVIAIIAAKLRTKSPATSAAQVQPVRQAEGKSQLAGQVIPTASGVSPGHSKPQRAQTTPAIKPRTQVGKKTNSKTPSRQTIRPNLHDEDATNFYPLPYGSGLTLDEGWEIVRVSLSPSDLASLGVLPVPEQNSAETVKADVVLGEDGMARSIRFVK